MKNQLHAITIFRFFAAAYVFIFHINMRSPLTEGSLLLPFIKNGAVGMVFFFVLSGFILAYSHESGDFRGYYRKRIARIYPPYLFMGIISLPFLAYVEHEKIFGMLALFLTTTQAWFFNVFGLWNFGGTWSVSVEMFFYCLFPLILSNINGNNCMKIMVASYVIGSVIYPVAMYLGDNYTVSIYYTTPIYRLPEFVFGVSLGYMFSNGFRLDRKWFFAGLLLLAYGLSLSNQSFLQRNYIILPALAIIFLSSDNLIKGESIFSKVFIYLGEISYSFYLMQIPLLLAIDRKLIPLFNSTIANHVFFFAINLALAAISYHAVERNNKIRSIIIGKKVVAQ
ncbi:O-acetyltransferase OatA [Phytobacter ursingii]|nr:O-acetyltransferase OatA [Phytobacter ursingii]